ncbi:MAG: glycerol-3-phosphate acyltransferase [Anaerolineae bacterium]
MIQFILAGMLGYLLGAVPTGVLVCWTLRGADVRQRGSGHIGGPNVPCVTGLRGGVRDALLGMAAVAGAGLLTEDPWAATVAGVMAVVGHDWSVLIRFGGGIGLSKLMGTLLWLDPLRTLGATIIVAILWLILVRLLHVHRARSTILVMLAAGPLLWALGFPLHTVLLGALGGMVVIIKTLPD